MNTIYDFFEQKVLSLSATCKVPIYIESYDTGFFVYRNKLNKICIGHLSDNTKDYTEKLNTLVESVSAYEYGLFNPYANEENFSEIQVNNRKLHYVVELGIFVFDSYYRAKHIENEEYLVNLDYGNYKHFNFYYNNRMKNKKPITLLGNYCEKFKAIYLASPVYTQITMEADGKPLISDYLSQEFIHNTKSLYSCTLTTDNIQTGVYLNSSILGHMEKKPIYIYTLCNLIKFLWEKGFVNAESPVEKLRNSINSTRISTNIEESLPYCFTDILRVHASDVNADKTFSLRFLNDLVNKKVPYYSFSMDSSQYQSIINNEFNIQNIQSTTKGFLQTLLQINDMNS